LAVLLDHCEVAQLHALERSEARPACLALAPAADRRSIFARPAVLNLAVFVRAEWAAHCGPSPSGRVDREAGAKLADAARDRLLDLRVADLAVLAQALDDLGNQAADLAELAFAEAACRARGCPETNTRGDKRLFRIERNAVLVAGDRRPIER